MTPTDESGKCPECGSIDRGTRYSMTPQLMDADPLARFCKNAWHHVPPEVHRDDFTEQQFLVIFGVCMGLSNLEIAMQCGIAEDVVKVTICNIFDKLGDVRNRVSLYMFARAALNAELRRRSGRGESA